MPEYIYHYHAVKHMPDGRVPHLDGIVKMDSPLTDMDDYALVKKKIAEIEPSMDGPEGLIIDSISLIRQTGNGDRPGETACRGTDDTAGIRSVRFNGCTWPIPDGDTEHRLRYGEPTKADLMYCASVIEAYRMILEASHTDRDHAIANVRRQIALKDKRGFGTSLKKKNRI